MWLRIFVVIFLILLIAPVLVMFPLSFNSSGLFTLPVDGFSFRWYEEFFKSDEWVGSFLMSIRYAILAAIIATTIGLIASLAVDRIEFPGKNIFSSFMISPMIIPLVVIGLALNKSYLTFGLTNTGTGMILGHTLVGIPLVFILVTSRLKSVDINLELAARSLGAAPMRAFFQITFPLIKIAILAGFVFAFVASLDEVIIGIFISGQATKTLPLLMFSYMSTHITPVIAVASSILITLFVILFLAFPKLIEMGKTLND